MDTGQQEPNFFMPYYQQHPCFPPWVKPPGLTAPMLPNFNSESAFFTHTETTYGAFEVDPFTGKKFVECNGQMLNENLQPFSSDFQRRRNEIIANHLSEERWHFIPDQNGLEYTFSAAPIPNGGRRKEVALLADTLMKVEPAINRHLEGIKNMDPLHYPPMNFPRDAAARSQLSGAEASELYKKLGQNIVMKIPIQQISHTECLGHEVVNNTFISKSRRADVQNCSVQCTKYYQDESSIYERCVTHTEGVKENSKKLIFKAVAYHPNNFSGCNHCEVKLKSVEKETTLSEYILQQEKQWAKAGIDSDKVWENYQNISSLSEALEQCDLSDKLASDSSLAEDIFNLNRSVQNHVNEIHKIESYDKYPYGDQLKKMNTSNLELTYKEAAELYSQICQDLKTVDFTDRVVKKCIGHHDFLATFGDSGKEGASLRSMSHQEIDNYKQVPGIKPSAVKTKAIDKKEGKKTVHDLFMLYEHKDNTSECSRFCNATHSKPTVRGMSKELQGVKNGIESHALDSNKELASLSKLAFGDRLELNDSRMVGGMQADQFYESMAREMAACEKSYMEAARFRAAIVSREKAFLNLPEEHFLPPKTKMLELGRKELNSAKVFYVNGINNLEKDAMISLEGISSMLEGHNVHGVYNPDKGSPENVLEAKHSADGHMNQAAVLLKYKIMEYLNENPNNIAYIFAHSHGTAVTHNALSELPEELLKRVSVLAVAPAKFVVNDKLKQIVHLESERDLVNLYDKEGREASKANTVTLTPHPDAPKLDHAFASPTYDTEKKKFLDRILGKHGDINE